jgi:pilus assembly protein CpaF
MAGHIDLEDLVADETLEEIWVNAPDRIFVSRNGISELLDLVVTADDVELWVERMLLNSNRRLDMSQPFVDAMLRDGSRLHVVIPDIVQNSWSVNVRKHLKQFRTLNKLVSDQVLSQSDADYLSECIHAGKNILVAGGTGAGKTTLLNCLINQVDSRERIISCEEVFEISLQHPDWVAMQTKPASVEGIGEVTLRHLVREALRMRPERLILGEVRQAECFDLLLALNSGQPGMATIHANSSSEAVLKLCTLPLLAGSNVTPGFVVPMVANAVHVIVHIARYKDGKRRVTSISTLTGKVIDNLPEIRTTNSLLKAS